MAGDLRELCSQAWVMEYARRKKLGLEGRQPLMCVLELWRRFWVKERLYGGLAWHCERSLFLLMALVVPFESEESIEGKPLTTRKILCWRKHKVNDMNLFVVCSPF